MPLCVVEGRPVVLFGDGDIGIVFMKFPSSPNPDGVGFVETDPGEVGREAWRKETDGKLTPPFLEIAFENVESLSVFIDALIDLRICMVQKRTFEDIHANG